jgi:hypothetical protein
MIRHRVPEGSRVATLKPPPSGLGLKRGHRPRRNRARSFERSRYPFYGTGSAETLGTRCEAPKLGFDRARCKPFCASSASRASSPPTLCTNESRCWSTASWLPCLSDMRIEEATRDQIMQSAKSRTSKRFLSTSSRLAQHVPIVRHLTRVPFDLKPLGARSSILLSTVSVTPVR